jgi:8-oxo-dGTP diphosphatase
VPVERRRRIEAYGLCRDPHGKVLLVADRWTLPGAVVAHGEPPEKTIMRAFANLGIPVTVHEIIQVITDVDRQPELITHHDRLIFDVQTAGEVPEHGVVRVADDELAGLDLPHFTAVALGLAPDPSPLRPSPPDVPTPNVVGLTPPSRHQRFAAYGLVTDPIGRVLLAQIADGYPGAGRWHLPGGGTDFGETAADGLLRELIEETDQRGRITGLLTASHRHTRDAVGPERVAIDWHGVRVVFRAQVDQPGQPRVVEGNGSTQAAAWFSPADALGLELTEVAHDAVAREAVAQQTVS